jgi:hypothetical protein
MKNNETKKEIIICVLPTCILIVLFHECGYCILGTNCEDTLLGGEGGGGGGGLCVGIA